jgi:hypothetical protein
MNSASGVPAAGSWSYCQLAAAGRNMESGAPRQQGPLVTCINAAWVLGKLDNCAAPISGHWQMQPVTQPPKAKQARNKA